MFVVGGGGWEVMFKNVTFLAKTVLSWETITVALEVSVCYLSLLSSDVTS